ncbi:hypothetical protein RK21_05347 [Pseudomonas plecoglossicida]|nr:hypothetical protein RK21_05347 [Pseudomonas plecoglossicida]
MCRERGAKRPQDVCIKLILLGPLCGPIATQGRSKFEGEQACHDASQS